MAVPQRKKSKAKKRSRRAQQGKLSLPAIAICDNCGADTIPHRVCGECGWYKDRIVVVVEDDYEGEEDEE